jgi:thiamine transport system ATP-binding protein
MSAQKGDVSLEHVKLKLGEHEFSFDLQIPSGSFAAITGPSGAGKSTLFNIIAGFDLPEQGRVLIGGSDMEGRAPGHRPLSLIFQDNNLFAHLDLFTNVALGLNPSARLSPEDRKTVWDALARVGLRGMDKRMPGTLSGGERQRAAFARALVRHRPLMLLDEPFAALDPGLRRDMGSLLKDLHHQEGFTVLMVTHDPEEAERLADMAAFIDQGRISVCAPIDRFMQLNQPEALVRFLGRETSSATIRSI